MPKDEYKADLDRINIIFMVALFLQTVRLEQFLKEQDSLNYILTMLDAIIRESFVFMLYVFYQIWVMAFVFYISAQIYNRTFPESDAEGTNQEYAFM